MPIVIPERTNSSTTAVAAIQAATTLDELKSACAILAGAVAAVEEIATPAVLKPADISPVAAIPAEPVVEDEVQPGGLG